MLPWNAEELVFDDTRFSGTVRLFPLPDLVMFPHVMQPLHIFEPRYREMLNDALDGDGLIAMSMLAPGWEADYDGRPAIIPHVCIGKVVTHQRLSDGCYNIMLLGSRRARVVNELPAMRTFREAEVELLDDIYNADGDAARDALQEELSRRFQMALPKPKGAKATAPLQQLLATELPLGVLTDLASFALPLSTAMKLRLLVECDVDRRAHLLLKALGAPTSPPRAVAGAADFPPRFSCN
ncbi:MAG TPA: LON peptidase substrate-binding domain-containing protein [Lacipirellula sp.]